MKQTYLVYVGITQSKPERHGFIDIPDLSLNNGSSGDSYRVKLYGKKMFKHNSIGSIHAVTMDENGQVTFNPKTAPVDFWKNKEDLVKWKAVQAPFLKITELMRKGEVNQLAAVLKPIQEAYADARYEERRYILAEVIRIITTM